MFAKLKLSVCFLNRVFTKRLAILLTTPMLKSSKIAWQGKFRILHIVENNIKFNLTVLGET
jgi:hypothetical protein